MSQKDQSVWTCDRCGKVECLLVGQQPSGWGRILYAVEQLFGAAAIQAEWMRELYEALHPTQSPEAPR